MKNPFSEYPSLALPLEYNMINPQQIRGWRITDVSDASRTALGPLLAKGMIAHPVGRIERNSTILMCLTFIEREGNPEVVLSTHNKENGELINSLVLARDARDGKPGFGCNVGKGFEVFRLEMFYITDERTGKQRPEADHEDVFWVDEEGKIVPGKR